MARDEVSTRFPFINLEKALEKAHTLFLGDRTCKPMLVTTAFDLWSYSPKSSGGFQTIGALKGYGLVEDEGSKEGRKIKLTEAARRYFLDERDEVRTDMLSEFALTPPLFRALWSNDRWSEGIPADTVARSHLKLERKLNDQSARSALAILKENVQFAGLKTGVIPDTPLESDADERAVSTPQRETSEAPMESSSMDVTESLIRESTIEPKKIAAAPFDARISGDRVIISANVDLKGLRRLKKQIKLLEQMLTLDDDDEDTEEAIKRNLP